MSKSKAGLLIWEMGGSTRASALPVISYDEHLFYGNYCDLR